MLYDDIERWLADPHATFTTGKYLLSSYGDTSVPASILAHENSYSWRKMREAMEALRDRCKAMPSGKIATTERQHILGQVKGYPPHLVEMDRMIPIYFSELNQLANRKFDYPEGDDLRELALEVVRRERHLSTMWNELHYFAATGMVMPGSVTDTLDKEDTIARLVDWLERQPTLIDYVRKYRNSKDASKKAEASTRQQEIDEIKAFITNYKQNAG